MEKRYSLTTSELLAILLAGILSGVSGTQMVYAYLRNEKNIVASFTLILVLTGLSLLIGRIGDRHR
jgi:F0F1-type ATP synthase membrane subunit c/vacuolar-type H+-ATPase subunit K